MIEDQQVSVEFANREFVLQETVQRWMWVSPQVDIKHGGRKNLIEQIQRQSKNCFETNGMKSVRTSGVSARDRGEVVVNETSTVEKSGVLKKAKKNNCLSSLYVCVRVKLVAAYSEDLYWKKNPQNNNKKNPKQTKPKQQHMQISKTWSVSVSLSFNCILKYQYEFVTLLRIEDRSKLDYPFKIY